MWHCLIRDQGRQVAPQDWRSFDGSHFCARTWKRPQACLLSFLPLSLAGRSRGFNGWARLWISTSYHRLSAAASSGKLPNQSLLHSSTFLLKVGQSRCRSSQHPWLHPHSRSCQKWAFDWSGPIHKTVLLWDARCLQLVKPPYWET